jgi:hypothetical protein
MKPYLSAVSRKSLPHSRSYRKNAGCAAKVSGKGEFEVCGSGGVCRYLGSGAAGAGSICCAGWILMALIAYLGSDLK